MVGATLGVLLGLFFQVGEPIWPDLSVVPSTVGGGENDAAVVVCVEDYVYLPDVLGAEAVGVAWNLFLSQVLRVPTVLLLRSGDATPAKMRNALESAGKRVLPGGRLWFVYVGHGSPSRDGKDGLLVGVTAQPDEFDFFPHTLNRSEVMKIVTSVEAAGQPPVVVIDACFSGTDAQGKALLKGAQFIVSAEMASFDDAVLMTAGRATDIAGPLPGASVPAFSYLLLGALQGWGDLDCDGTVRAREAVRYVQETLLRLEPGRKQQPQWEGPDADLVTGPKARTCPSGPDLGRIAEELRQPAGKPGGDVGKGDAETDADGGAWKNLPHGGTWLVGVLDDAETRGGVATTGPILEQSLSELGFPVQGADQAAGVILKWMGSDSAARVRVSKEFSADFLLLGTLKVTPLTQAAGMEFAQAQGKIVVVEGSTGLVVLTVAVQQKGAGLGFEQAAENALKSAADAVFVKIQEKVLTRPVKGGGK